VAKERKGGIQMQKVFLDYIKQSLKETKNM
jgi:hypothetical protein